MATYSFTTRWKTRAPLDAVWDAIYTSDHWPQWWKYVQKVELLKKGDENDIGSVRRFYWTTALPYSFHFDMTSTRVEKNQTIEGKAGGELEGTGRWTFRQEGDRVCVQYDWNVGTNKAWMNLLSPLLRPAFNWNHKKVMEAGRLGLARQLGAEVVDM